MLFLTLATESSFTKSGQVRPRSDCTFALCFCSVTVLLSCHYVPFAQVDNSICILGQVHLYGKSGLQQKREMQTVQH